MTLLRALAGSILLLWLAACGPASEPPSPEDGTTAGMERATVEAQVRPGMLELRRWREPRERIVIDRAGALVGTAGGTPVRKLFTRPERLRDFLFFVRTYRPFRLRNGDQDLAFGGQGAVKPGPVEQRMIAEWARGLAAELSSSGSADDYGLVVAWHRGGAAGSCDNLVIFLDGEVRASACAGGGEEFRGRLRPEQLARIYAWYEELKPLQVTSASEAGPTQAPARLTFAGRGTREASPPEIAALQSLSAALHRELMARHGALPAPQPAPPPTPRTPRTPRTTGEAPEPEAPGPDLLVPEGPVAPLPPPRAVLPQHIPPPSREDTLQEGVSTRPHLPGGTGGAGPVR